MIYLNYFDFKIYPKVDSILFNKESWILYSIFFLYLNIPIVIEGADRLKWR